MAGRRYTYTIGIEADTTQFKTQLNEAIKSLEAISGAKLKTPTYTLEEAASNASFLAKSLREAVNVDTGKFNLATFANSLKSSGKDLRTYRESLGLLGADGNKAFKDMASAIVTAEAPLKRTNKLVNDFWVTLKNTVKWQATNKLVNTFTGMLETAYGYSKDLDRSLNNIRIVTGDSAKEMEKFSKQANAAAKALSTTTVDYTDAALIYAQQGNLRIKKFI